LLLFVYWPTTPPTTPPTTTPTTTPTQPPTDNRNHEATFASVFYCDALVSLVMFFISLRTAELIRPGKIACNVEPSEPELVRWYFFLRLSPASTISSAAFCGVPFG